MRDPAFWWRKPGLAASLLAPLGLAYGAITARRMAQPGAQVGIPVICVGNFTLGGTGKTPTAMMLVELLRGMGATPFCLTRGYGGSIEGPHLVDAKKDSAAQVGDEALLLARTAPTVVSRDRVKGAAFAKIKGATVIVMDDGLQNPSLAKTLSIAVIDGRRGLGNGAVFPAGPLRAPLDVQLAKANALLVVGADEHDVTAGALPVLRGRLVPDDTALATIRGGRVLAFAGIGDPEKFFATVEACGFAIGQRRGFADHHRFAAAEAAELIAVAERDGLALITTAKDRARMNGDPALDALAQKSHVLPVTMVIRESDLLHGLLAQALG